MAPQRTSPTGAGSAPAAVARIAAAGDSALTVTLGEAMDREVSRRVLALGARVMHEGGEGVIEVVPGIASLTVHFDPDARDLDELSERLMSLAAGLTDGIEAGRARRWTIPACYDPSLALDLVEVSARCGIAPDNLVARHASADFHVYMLGFLPGFPYMGELDPDLRLPRRADPRLEVPAGAVAIAGAMTAIYPTASPGGWHVIARTPAPLFDAAADPPSILAPGDRVRFQQISRDAFDELAGQVRAGAWRLAPDAETA